MLPLVNKHVSSIINVVYLVDFILNIAYAQHGLGQDSECKTNLIDAYYANHLMKNFLSCDVVREYAKEIFGNDFPF